MKLHSPFFAQGQLGNRILGLILVFSVVALLFFYVFPIDEILAWKNGRKIGVGKTGVHHMGQNFSISEFYINGYGGSKVGREGGGGSDLCCTMLPDKWRPGLKAEIRWAVVDWSKENLKETDHGDYHSLTWKYFKAVVPLERYVDSPGQLYVHFFSGGRVRMISSDFGSESPNHPIKFDDPHAADIATIGKETSSDYLTEKIDNKLKKQE